MSTPRLQTGKPTMTKNNEGQLATRLGVVFKNPALLHTSLVHRSYLNEKKSEVASNERLEFLGDAILEFIVSDSIYRNYPRLDEGKLTALRARLVNTISLAEISKSLGIGEALYLSKGEIEGGGRSNQSLLADAFEAIVGAIFIDQGIDGARQVIDQFVLPKAEAALTRLKDAKSLLQEVVQAQGRVTPIYRVISQIGPDHARVFTVGAYVNQTELGVGNGKSKQVAEQKAAEDALTNLQETKI